MHRFPVLRFSKGIFIEFSFACDNFSPEEKECQLSIRAKILIKKKANNENIIMKLYILILKYENKRALRLKMG